MQVTVSRLGGPVPVSLAAPYVRLPSGVGARASRYR